MYQNGKLTGYVRLTQYIRECRSAGGQDEPKLTLVRVTTNKGANTPGVDKVVWLNGYDKLHAAKNLKTRGYSPIPLRRVYILKKNGKKRPLSIPCMHDRAMQALFAIALDPVAETTADPNSYGFRAKRSCADAVAQCFLSLCRKTSAQWVFEADIKSCFDEINHDWIMENIPLNKTILRKWLMAGYIDKNRLFPTSKGTPQGGIISPTIMNMVLDGLETAINRQFPVWKRQKVNFIRYADDFIITASSEELIKAEIIPLVIDFLKLRGLQLSEDKSKITHINDGFDFLSQNIRKYKGSQTYRLYRIAFVPIRYHVKIKSSTNPYMPEFDKYFFLRQKWRENVAKECGQITTFDINVTNINSRGSCSRVTL